VSGSVLAPISRRHTEPDRHAVFGRVYAWAAVSSGGGSLHACGSCCRSPLHTVESNTHPGCIARRKRFDVVHSLPAVFAPRHCVSDTWHQRLGMRGSPACSCIWYVCVPVCCLMSCPRRMQHAGRSSALRRPSCCSGFHLSHGLAAAAHSDGKPRVRLSLCPCPFWYHRLHSLPARQCTHAPTAVDRGDPTASSR